MKSFNVFIFKVLVSMIVFYGSVTALVILCSANVVNNAVYTVDDGVYYHSHGDCAVCEKSHDHNRKIRITSKETAEAKLFIPCRKCCK